MALEGKKVIRVQKGFQAKFTRSSCDTTFGGGVLNPQPKGSLVLTPKGFVKIEDLKVGDEICGIENKVQTITHSTDEGLKDCVRLILEDGSKAESALDHKWLVYKKDRGDFIATSWEILEAMQIIGDNNTDSDICLYKYNKDTFKIERFLLEECIDLGKKEVICIGVSNNDELYITDDYMVTKNCGKTFAAILTIAEPSLDPNFRAVFTRRNLANLKVSGGIIDDFKTAYGDLINIKIADTPRATFPNGSWVDFLHIADENPGKLMERVKGIQADFIYLDELTSYEEFSTFSILGTRVRGKAKWTGHLFGTTNPKRSHWVRQMLDWYIGADGFIMPSRDGVVRYYYQAGERVNQIVWGDSKEEVYRLCKADIDKKLKKLGGDFTYEDIIRSFVFYLGRMSENMASIGGNKGYIGSVAAVGGRRAQQLIEGNFNVDEDADDEAPIKAEDAIAVFNQDPQVNGDKWITADLADVGSDNMVVIVWDGFHMLDVRVIQTSTPKYNADVLLETAKEFNIADSHIIYDGVAAAYMLDYIPEAIPYRSFELPCGLDGRAVYSLKDECYLRLIKTIRDGRLSCSDKVANMRYFHKKIKTDTWFSAEFVEECSVVRWKELPSGKKRLFSKKDMNAKLGKGRSMDVLDPCAMRMYPVLRYHVGEELAMTANYDNDKGEEVTTFDIYNDSTWA